MRTTGPPHQHGDQWDENLVCAHARKRPTARLRQAGAMMFKCKHEPDPGLAWSRNVRPLSCQAACCANHRVSGKTSTGSCFQYRLYARTLPSCPIVKIKDRKTRRSSDLLGRRRVRLLAAQIIVYLERPLLALVSNTVCTPGPCHHAQSSK